jgi:hypothetical protein
MPRRLSRKNGQTKHATAFAFKNTGFTANFADAGSIGSRSGDAIETYFGLPDLAATTTAAYNMKYFF